MRHGYTHITLVTDRSGSMNVIRRDAEGGVNHFITEQKAVDGEATLYFVEFDATVEDWYHVVHDGDLRLAPGYVLGPRGATALLDAIGRAITETGEKLSALPEDERPEHVVFVVQTDGQENSSREWNLEAIRATIKRQTDEWNWHFLFLGMGPDTFEQGHDMGFANVTRSADSGDAYLAAYAHSHSHVANLRGGLVTDLSATNAAVDEHGNVTPTDHAHNVAGHSHSTP